MDDYTHNTEWLCSHALLGCDTQAHLRGRQPHHTHVGNLKTMRTSVFYLLPSGTWRSPQRCTEHWVVFAKPSQRQQDSMCSRPSSTTVSHTFLAYPILMTHTWLQPGKIHNSCFEVKNDVYTSLLPVATSMHRTLVYICVGLAEATIFSALRHIAVNFRSPLFIGLN